MTMRPQRVTISPRPGVETTFEWTRAQDAILLVDCCNEVGGMSVTNAAEEVIMHLQPTVPVYYQDTMGQWDELKHEGGKFAGFAPIPDELRVQLDSTWTDAVFKGDEVTRL